MVEPNDEFVRKATAHQRGGAGSHKDRRTRRKRTRTDQNRWAKYDQEDKNAEV